MPEASKIRVQFSGDIAEIRMLLAHPMETGLRKDESGKMVAAHFIQMLTVSLNGKPLISAQLNTSVAKNPFFAFRTRGIKPGDKLAVQWIDSRGEKRSDEMTVA